MQGAFLCAEAHPDLGGSLLVVAVSESLLSWDDYCKALPSTALPDDLDDADANNCFEHPAVHAATMKVLVPCTHPRDIVTRIRQTSCNLSLIRQAAVTAAPITDTVSPAGQG